MGLDLCYYLGYAVKIPENDYWDIIDAHPEYNKYDAVGSVSYVVDNMNGDFSLLMYVLDKAHDDEMYSGFEAVKTFNPTLTEEIKSQLSEAYKVFTGQELDTSNIKLTRAFNCY